MSLTIPTKGLPRKEKKGTTTTKLADAYRSKSSYQEHEKRGRALNWVKSLRRRSRDVQRAKSDATGCWGILSRKVLHSFGRYV